MELNTKKKSVSIIMGYLNLIIQNGVVFFLTPIMIMVWDASSFGLYRLLLSFMTYFMLIDAGVCNTIVRFITEYKAKDDKEKEKKYVGFLLLFYTLAVLVLSIIVIILSKYVPNIYSNSMTELEIKTIISVLPWITVYAGASLFFNCFTAIMRAHNAHTAVQFINIIKALVRFIMLWSVLSNDGTILSVVATDALLAVVVTLFVLLFVTCKMRITPNILGLDRKLLKQIFEFTSTMFINTLAFAMFWSLDSIILSLLTTTALVGVYAVGSTITNLFQSLSSIISQVIVPDIMVLGHNSDDKKLLDDKMVQVGRLKFMWLLLPAIGFISFGRQFLDLWVGEGFEDAYIIVVIVLIPQLIALIQDVPSNIMYVRNKHKPMAWFSVMAAVLKLLLTIVLVLNFGIVGAAVGTSVAFTMVYIVFTSYYYSKILDFDMLRLYKETIFNKTYIYILVLIIGFFMGQILNNNWYIFFISITIFSLIYSSLIWLQIMNREEKIIILNLFKKRIN